MSIQILPPRLANQIAAGEVVERPSSVIKELVENSLDAGADNIVINIEKGGHKRICLTDNGNGVSKEELRLALSRHATSKISTLDDLQAIMSLGFRGEALASISSVSRMTFTSKPASQQQAWQAVAEGREMEVRLNPTAHPNGTTVDVLDLFFNTPARRKFLRTEKTEFAHIDETVRRIALSRFDVQIVLNHNGKEVKRYRKTESQENKKKRVLAVCGKGFIENSIEVESVHEGLKLSGWLGTKQALRKQNDTQYFYVNGRMMRDKVINHAIRQAFANVLDESLYPAFVLFLQLSPTEVDVNVHPAKHEVRFHNTRLVHDFISHVLVSALAQNSIREQSSITKTYEIRESSHQYQPQPLTKVARESAEVKSVDLPKPIANADNNYPTASEELSNAKPRLLAIIENKFALLAQSNDVYLFEIAELQRQILQDYFNQSVTSQPLLMPVVIKLEQQLVNVAENNQFEFQDLGFHYLLNGNQLILRQVPSLLRNHDLNQLILLMLSKQSDFTNQLIKLLLEKKQYDVQSVSQLLNQRDWSEIYAICHQLDAAQLTKLLHD